MTFQPDLVNDFLALFDKHKNDIRAFKGVKYLELLRDSEDPNVFFTYSIWDDAKNLELYRRSPLFIKVWSTTKQYFSQPPAAWSLESQLRLP